MFADTFFPTTDGVVTSMVSVARQLQAKGHRVRFFVPRPKDPKKSEHLWQDLDVVFVRSFGLLTYSDYRVAPHTSLSAKKRFAEFRPDVVHVHTPFSLGWMGMRWAKRKKIPVVATYHTLLPEFMMYLPLPIFNRTKFAKRLTWRYTNMFYGKADVLTTPTEQMADELKREGLSATALSNPIRYSLFNRFEKEKKPAKPFRLVFFGRMSFEKNIDVVVQATAGLIGKGHAVELILIGEGPAVESLKKLAQALKISSHVQFVGVLRDEALAKKVASCHLTVTASTMETQGLTILEAMSSGLPCVGCDFLGIPNAVKDGYNGFLFPPGDALACAEKIEVLLKSKSMYEQFSKHAVKTAEALSEEKIVSKYLSIYESLVTKKK
ncbi:MAG: glycosyltransferase [Candidatus Diapherotrites archaeon]|nr:glycosyltransferase [Candidatus Diapherotrites archaeon]